MKFWDSLRRLTDAVMYQKRLSQAELARMLSTATATLHPQSMSRFMGGSSTLKPVHLDRLLEWLKRNGYTVTVPEPKRKKGSK
jgi:hypothetical protein